MKFTRNRFQHGCLSSEKRKSGPDAWIFRWRESDATGNRVNRKIVIGTVEQFKTKSAAEDAVAAVRLEINKETRSGQLQRITVSQLVAHYTAKELSGERCNKSFSTCEGYRSYLNNWILPRWQGYLIANVRTVAVEDWLAELELAPGTKAKIRNVMSAIFNHAIRHEWTDKNPITGPMRGAGVRQSAKRQQIPVVLDVDEIKRLLTELQQPTLAMMALDGATGLRRSELLGLKWSDIDFQKSEIKSQSCSGTSGSWRAKNGGIKEACPVATRSGGTAARLERSFGLSQPRRLGVCLCSDGR